MSVILKNNHITLLPLDKSHEAAFVRLANIPDINLRVNKPPLYTIEHFSDQLLKTEKNKKFFVWMIESESNLVGVINSAARIEPTIFQGGYWVDPEYRGKNIASGALNLVNDYLCANHDAQRIQALVEPDNMASIQVLEKCGYTKEGLLRKYYPSVNRGLIDVIMYARVF